MEAKGEEGKVFFRSRGNIGSKRGRTSRDPALGGHPRSMNICPVGVFRRGGFYIPPPPATRGDTREGGD